MDDVSEKKDDVDWESSDGGKDLIRINQQRTPRSSDSPVDSPPTPVVVNTTETKLIQEHPEERRLRKDALNRIEKVLDDNEGRETPRSASYQDVIGNDDSSDSEEQDCRLNLSGNSSSIVSALMANMATPRNDEPETVEQYRRETAPGDEENKQEQIEPGGLSYMVFPTSLNKEDYV